MKTAENKKLRTGYTTGTCAVAATKAAMIALQDQTSVSSVEINLPIGRAVCLEIRQCRYDDSHAFCSTIKDAGDDPDVTHGAEICATVSWGEEPGVHIDGGQGVGVVTKPGLGLEVGKAAINPVPRQMITQAIQEVVGEALARRGVNVVISVPAGKELAKKTLNPRLGIIGGISILGTTGIVVPYSTSAYRAAIAQALDVAVANQCEHVVLTTGGRTERFAQQVLSHLAEEAFVQIGEFLGFALKECQRRSIARVTFCGMIGKFSKVAAGASCLHVKNSQVDMNFLAELAAECGASEELVTNIKKANTARHVSELAIEHGLPELHTKICESTYQHCMQVLQDATELECILVGFVGDVLARVTHES